MSRTKLRSVVATCAPPLLVGLVAFGCSSTATHAATTAAPTGRPTTTSAPAASTTVQPQADVRITAASFRNLETMTPVRGFFVANLMGHLDATLAVASSTKNGGVYPTGTLLQLVPTEAMVKHRPGWNPATDDWEFFSLAVSPSGTKILSRGIQNVVNRFGGNCASCHSAAEKKFDFVCEHDHGCAPLPIGDSVIRAIQLADPRPTA